MTQKNNKFQCLLCGNQMKFLLIGSDLLYKTTTKTYSVYKCQNCGLEKIEPMPSAREISLFYPKTYYAYNAAAKAPLNFFGRLREKIIEINYRKNVRKDLFYYLASIAQKSLSGLPLQLVQNGKFLDIGCGDGYNMHLMKKYGWDTTGFEIGKQKKVGNIYYDSDINSIHFGKKFNFIRVWHVLEHVPNPRKFVKKISELMTADGAVMLGIPNTTSFNAYLFGKYWYNRDIPRHLYNYNPTNLTLLFKEYNLEPYSIRYVSAGGYIGSIQHTINTTFKTNYDLINNQILFLITYPIDILCNFFKRGDSLAITFRKVKE